MTFLRTPTIRPLSITVVRVIALTGFVAAAAFIIRFAVFGSFHFVLNVNSPLNAECFAGLLFVALALLQPGYATLSRENTRRDFRLWLFITAAVTLAFVRTVNNPLLHDSYTHVVTAAKETWFTTLQIFYRHPASGDFFYRPVGYVSFWLDSKWAGFDPFRWHLVSLALHAVNSNLVYCFARQLAFTRTGSLVAALLFAFHGSRPEAVVWVAARFDLLAAFFLLLTLIAFCRFTATGSRPWLAALPVFTILALLSKEAAYCLPLLAFALLPLVPPPAKRRTRALKLCFVLLVLTIAVFLYRWWVLQSIGGYQSATGGPAILHFSMLRTMKALFFREWGLLFFPLNWSIAPSALEITAILGILVVMAMALLVSKPDKRRLLAALGFVIAISIPVQHLLLISADLNGSRVLYLPVLGFALFWAVLVDGCGNLRIQQTVVVMLVLCHFLLLNHNLNIWSRVADLSRNTCLELGKRLSSDEQPVLVRNLPVKQDGVYFLRNGFPQCVFATSGISPNRIQVDDTQPAVPGERIFVWDESCGKLEERVSQISPSQ